MERWVAIPALLPIFMASAGIAQTKGPVARHDPASHSRILDLSIVEGENDSPGLLQNGMLTEKELGTDSFLGVGMVRMHGRKKDGSDMRPGSDPVTTRNPAVTFVLKF